MLTEEKFVGLEGPQVISAKKQLLYCEMEILKSMQKNSRYKKLRKEELSLKNLLKKVIFDLRKEMDLLMEYMPQIKVDLVKTEPAKTMVEKRDSIEYEIQNIRRKIDFLSSH